MPQPKPKSCEFDYGRSYGLTPRGRGKRLCVSDSVSDPRASRLPAGHTIQRYGMRCRAHTAGRLRCVNTHGHGFTIGPAHQHVF